MQQIKYDVFISYSSKDYIDAYKKVKPDNVLSKIKAAFTEAGISYWFDEEGVYSGDEFAPVLAKAIKNSEIVLYVSSVNSNSSEWTRSEIAVSHSYKKKIIPFKIDDSLYDDSVIIYLATLDYIDYQVNPSKAIQDLLEGVKNYLKKRKKEIEKSEAEERAQSERKKAEHARFQSELIASIKQGINDLDTEEIKADSLRRSLMTDLEMVDSSLEKEYLSGMLGKSGVIHVRHAEECERLSAEIETYKEIAKQTPQIRKQPKSIIYIIIFLMVALTASLYLCLELYDQNEWLEYERDNNEVKLAYCQKELKLYNENIPILITDVEIGVTDQSGNIIVAHGSKIYSKDTQYLSPKVTINVFDIGPQLIKVKFYKNGELRGMENKGYSYQFEYETETTGMMRQEIWTGWGSASTGHWSPGKYRFEFWVGDYCIGSKEFKVFE